MANKTISLNYRPKTNGIKGKYEGKYYTSDDVIQKGRDGQHVRLTNNDFCEVIEIFALAKGVTDRYDEYFQKSYGKTLISSGNILTKFKLKYNNKIVNSPNEGETKAVLFNNYDVIVNYNENSNVAIQNSVLGNNLVEVLETIIDTMININTEISLHIHPNVVASPNYRTGEINNKLTKIKDNLQLILSTNEYLN